MSARGITLSRHILQQSRRHAVMAGELAEILHQLGFAAKILAREIRRAALVGKLGLVGDKNPTGDAQKKLDVFAHETVVEAFAASGLVAGIISEELEQVATVACGNTARYILCTDPLDGSSNTDVNGAVGTIFAICEKSQGGCEDVASELLGGECWLAAAGYVLYGPSTTFVYTSGGGVYGFTLDHDLGEFLLSHDKIECPARGRSYSANLGHSQRWDPHLRALVAYLNEPDPATHRPYSLRYTGALVADVHRILLEGGIYFYPPDAGHPEGKLRLFYECIPLAFLVEQAGGRASTGRRRILEVRGETLHQRAPLVLGSAADVSLYERFLESGGP